MLYYLDLFGTAIFAISGILIARRLQMDIFGMLVLATVTAIGGGTIRDMALGATPVFWIQQPPYLLIILTTCVFATPILRFNSHRLAFQFLLLADAIGLATFTAIGVEKALAHEAAGIAAVGLGVLTGVGGGIIRDILAREIPMILRTEIYATACIAGGSIHVLAVTLIGLPNQLAMLLGITITLLLRLAGIYWKWQLPILGKNIG